MDYIKDVFERMDLQRVRQFILDGVGEGDADCLPYSERLKAASEAILNRLMDIYPISDEQDRATADLYEALDAYETVFMELGMKAGARLVYQLLLVDDVPCQFVGASDTT
jgi:hypothetical protein